MDTDKKPRREFLHIMSWLFPASFFFWGSLGCQSTKEEAATSCQDLSDLKDSELAVRHQLGYVDQSAFEDRSCVNCQLFVKTDQALDCGNCLAMKGRVMDQGYCTVWAPIME